LGAVAVVMLVLLRFCVGFHFYTEGIDKVSGDFDAGKFFATARGPFAEKFQQQIWDWDGSIRLDQERTVNFWAVYREGIKKHFNFNDQQAAKVDQAYLRARAQLEWILASNATEIEEFELGKQRINALREDDMRDGVASLGGQRDSIRKEWQGLISPVFVQIDKAWTNFETEANDVATTEQVAKRGIYKLGKPRDVIIDTSLINPIIPYFDLTIGICLLLGLFTPIAALVAAGFLGSVFMSQYPPVAGPGSTYYHLVEAAACLVLAGTGAGRFAGLDFIFYAISARLWPTNKEV
jgi:uncharacterized membrane protein YphA (DoxX/SURF4 family)